MCASSCWNLRTRVKTVQRAAELVAVEHAKVGEPHGQLAEGSPVLPNITQCPGQFIGFRPNSAFSTSNENMFSL